MLLAYLLIGAVAWVERPDSDLTIDLFITTISAASRFGVSLFSTLDEHRHVLQLIMILLNWPADI